MYWGNIPFIIYKLYIFNINGFQLRLRYNVVYLSGHI